MDTTTTIEKPVDKSVVIESSDGSAVYHDVAPKTGGSEHPAGGAEHPGDDDGTTAAAQEEAELAAAHDEEEREKIRARRREERRTKRDERRRREVDTRQQLAMRDRQIEELTNAVNVLQRRSVGTELAELDNEIQTADRAAIQLRNAIAEGTKSQNGELVAEATDRLMKVNQRASELNRIRSTFMDGQRRAAQPQPPAALPPDPMVVSLGQRWVANNSWYDSQARDIDSRIARELDNAVIAEGYDPKTTEYWDELSDRVAKYLPHRANAANNGGTSTRRPVGSPVAGSGRETSGAAGAGKSGYVLSAARVQALKDANIWDNPEKRADMIRRYQQADREEASRR
jgi:hypothetical protein